MSPSRFAIVFGLVTVGFSCSTIAQERNLYWGDLHLHTKYSATIQERAYSSPIWYSP